MTTPMLERDLKFDEALRGIAVLSAYPDPLSGGDPWTIGWGHAGPEVSQGVTWTVEQCQVALVADIARAERSLDAQMPWWRGMCDARQDVLVNMCFNLGIGKLEGFHHTLAAMQAGDYESAAQGMENSLWAHQVHGRAARLAAQMRTGVRAGDHPQQETHSMSLISSAFHFVWDHTFAAAARSAATASPDAAAAGIAAISITPMPATGSPNSSAGVASPIIQKLEDDLNVVVMAFVKSAVDQLPVVGGIASATGLDQRAADAAKVMLVLGEQHALTYLSALFSGHHLAVNASIAPTNGPPASDPQ